MESVAVPAGGLIVMVGDPATKAFLIRKGTVELRRGTGGTTDVEEHLGVGQVFGELALLEEHTYALSARAVSDVELTVLPKSEFELLLSGVPADYTAFLKALFERAKKGTSSSAATPETALAVSSVHDLVTIHPLTRRAAATLPREGLVVDKFPFRIGRAAAQNEEIPSDVNDLWLSDQMPFNVSRTHAVLERVGNRVVVKDRGSSLGMFVNETQIGGRAREKQMALDEGDNIVVLGGPMSPYQFRISLTRD